MPQEFKEIVESLTLKGVDIGFVQKRDVRIKTVQVYAAKKVDTGLEALLIHADPTHLPPPDEWPISEGFNVELLPVIHGSNSYTVVCLELSAPEYREVFLSLAEDICGGLIEAISAEEAIRFVHRRLYRWQNFLRKHKADGLSDAEQIGLFGELEVLRTLFLSVLSSVQTIEGWRGCKKASQDFQFPGFALEVKTTRAVTPDRINISNVQQLDEQGIEKMFLTVVWVNRGESAGISLPAIIEEIRQDLVEPAVGLFNEGLKEVGYLDAHAAKYDKHLYQVRRIVSYEVSDHFPRITFDQLAEGVKGVKYQISLDACIPFERKQEYLSSAIKDLNEPPCNE